jgi:CopA family copper-resistance protein
MLTRRRFLHGSSAAGAAAAFAPAALLPGWARGQGIADTGPQTQFDLRIAETPFAVEGRRAAATTINGGVPGPLLRWREGDEVTLRVANALDEDTSLHWHGILLPNAMDGVPGVTFAGIAPGQTFEYRFPVRQSGTYWYHSHSGFQEQAGVYGPIVIDPAGPDPVAYDREHVIVLSDWSFMAPERIFGALKKQSDYFNFQKPTLFGREDVPDRAMWARMRMNPSDLADVNGSTYTFLINGQGPEANWTGLFAAGERVRLRVINASAMTIFDVRIPGLKMTVVAADGIDVKPVDTDEFRISVAETYDVIVTPGDGAWTVFAEALDRSGFARGTLAPAAGMAAAVPALRPRPLRSMADMGMDHGAHGAEAADHSVHGGVDAGAATPAGMAGMDHGAMDQAAMEPGAVAGDAMDHSTMDHGAAAAPVVATGPQPQAHPHRMGPGVDAVPDMTANRLHEPGVGLGEDGWGVLTYAQLESAAPNRDARAPERELELHLTGNMERFVWGFDGERFIDVHDPIQWRLGERLRLTLVNDSMMEHPIHLHGMFMELENGAANRPLKHTINVKPAERLSLLVTADEPGDWAFHCHLLYHMAAGMMRVVRVAQGGPSAQAPVADHSAPAAAHEGHEAPQPQPAPAADHSAHEGH